MIVLIKRIKQLSQSSFQIDWSDNKCSVFELSFLQKSCPCMKCNSLGNKELFEVRVRKISSVGNYAIRIDFINGCNRGIFTFDFLRTLHLEEM